MVSLSRSFNTNSGGATFFSESGNMADSEYLQPILESYGTFRPLNTVPAFSIHLLVTLALEILAIIYAVKHPDESSRCQEYFIVIYVHVGLWFITLIVDQVARKKHYNMRILGYLEFYNNTAVHHRLPFYTVSLCSAVLVLIQALMQQYYPDNFAEKCINGGAMSPTGYLCALITFEFCLIAGININYIIKVRKFNKQKAPPDVQKEEWNACQSPEATEVGSPMRGEKLHDFLQKQADLIRFLKEHNAKLGEKLMVLSAQLQARA
ncbi:hypothetical protein Zmor_020667 [Zophobas morio]|uniref:Transmembrane protein 192 n=1 Tax=Zophobas morio TaxID=2755281 RepID=A0AA38I1P1_9CUCU|nr:hypothetical protein Zmor_020667 [Zophobas morio]